MIKKAVYLLVGALVFFSCAKKEQTRPPNIVYILADDLGYGDVSVYNPESKIETPNIDRLASEGMRFTDAYVDSPYCKPTRSSLMTGKYNQRLKMQTMVMLQLMVSKVIRKKLESGN